MCPKQGHLFLYCQSTLLRRQGRQGMVRRRRIHERRQGVLHRQSRYTPRSPSVTSLPPTIRIETREGPLPVESHPGGLLSSSYPTTELTCLIYYQGPQQERHFDPVPPSLGWVPKYSS